MKIFDCFMFKDELDLLEIRFQELYDSVDFFVVVESNLSHTRRSKSYNFENHSSRFQPWLDKVRYIKHVSSSHDNPWSNENDQRTAISKGLTDVNDCDIVIVSDIDEVVRASCVDQIKHDTTWNMLGFHMPLYNFKFNYMRVNPGAYDIWAMATHGGWIKQHGAQQLRNLRQNLDQFEKIHHGGWHFSYLGDTQGLYNKALDCCHQEDIFPEFLAQLDVDKSIKEKKCWNRWWPYDYEIVNLDDYFPKACRNYPQHCLPDSGVDLRNLVSHCE